MALVEVGTPFINLHTHHCLKLNLVMLHLRKKLARFAKPFSKVYWYIKFFVFSDIYFEYRYVEMMNFAYLM